jgi:hypothetical protein
MPLRDRHGKSAEDYQESLITALDSISLRPRESRGIPMRWVWWLIPVAALWLNWNQVQTYFKPVPTTMTRLTSYVPAAISSRIPEPAVHIVTEPHEARAQPQPLFDCLAGGTVIDEQVLHCRFGAVPRARTEPESRHGIVSAAYMARYEAERNVRLDKGSGRRQVGAESHWISGWDGHGSYLATWQVANNEIDSSSVCLNHRRGSIEYRECRKGAKQWFKDQCQSGGGSGEAARRRYCSAGGCQKFCVRA